MDSGKKFLVDVFWEFCFAYRLGFEIDGNLGFGF